MSETHLQNTLKYKFMGALTKSQHSKNPLTRNISSGIMKSMVSLHNAIGDKTHEKETEILKNKLENDDRNKVKVKKIIKESIDKYKETCSSSLTKEDQIEMIIVLLDTILKRVQGQSNDDLLDSLKYIKKITNLACNVSSQEHKLLIQEYIKYLSKNKEDERHDFLLNLFNQVKTKHSSRKSSRIGSRKGSLIEFNLHNRRSSNISNISRIPTIRNSSVYLDN